VQTLLAEGLVDELRLLTFPVAIGGDLKVFPDDRGKIALKLDELVRYDTGVLLQIYHPA
jgi:riboflavin biosynthesis pyrimidine reductase